MDDRKAPWVASALGLVAVGSFWLARPIAHSVPLRLLEQRRVTSPVGGDPDAAVLFRLAEDRTVHEAAEEGKRLEFWLVGDGGPSYPLLPTGSREGSELKLQSGYPSRVERPKIVVLADGKPIGSARVADVPAPREESLKPTSNPPFRLLNRGGSELDVEPRTPLQTDERWRLTALRATYAAHLNAETELPRRFSWPDKGYLHIPFASGAKAVEMDLVRERLERTTETVVVPNLRLVRRGGRMEIVSDEGERSFTTPLGATLRLERPPSGRRRDSEHHSPHYAGANLSVAPPPKYRVDRVSHPHAFTAGYLIDIVSPSAESLGLADLRLGPARSAARGKLAPLDFRPFTATLRLTYFRYVPFDHRRVIVAIERGASEPERLAGRPDVGRWPVAYGMVTP